MTQAMPDDLWRDFPKTATEFEARFATNLVLACFLIGAGVGHIKDIITAGNFAPGNAGPILFTDLLTPTAIFLLLCLTRSRGEKREAALGCAQDSRASAATPAACHQSSRRQHGSCRARSAWAGEPSRQDPCAVVFQPLVWLCSR